MVATGGSAVNMTGGRIQGNTNAAVGGLSLIGSGAAPVSLNNVLIADNAGGISAGGVYLRSNHSLTLTNSTISGNSTTSTDSTRAAGIRLDYGNPLTLQGVTVSGNTGRGVAINPGGGPIAQLVNTTISGNSGDGLYYTRSDNGGPPASLTNVTIANNGGAGLSTDLQNPPLQVKHTLVASNSGGNCQGPLTSQGHNMSSDGTCTSAFNGTGDLNNATLPLAPLATNGGTTKTHALLPNSAALDAIASGCPPPATDQRGIIRAQGPRCDVGAFEVVVVPANTPVVSPTPFFTPTPIPTATPVLLSAATATPTPVDPNTPTITQFRINGGVPSTIAATVRLDLLAIDNSGTVAEMSFSNDGVTFGPWEPYATLAEWTLTSGAGPKTVRARVRDRALNVSAVATANVTLGTVGVDPGIAVGGGAVYTRAATVPLTLSGPPGTTQMQVSEDPNFAGVPWEPYVTSKPFTLGGFGSSPAPRVVSYRFADAQGTVVGPFSDDILGDNVAPVGAIGIARQVPGTTQVVFNLGGTDDVSGVRDVEIAVQSSGGDVRGGGIVPLRPTGPAASAAFQRFTGQVTLTVTAGDTVTARFRDVAGNVSESPVSVKVPGLGASPASIAAGGTVTAAWSNVPNASTANWIGLYAVGADDRDWLAERFLSGQPTGSTAFAVPASAAPGTYHLRMYGQKGLADRLATGPDFTVTSLQATPTATPPAGSLTPTATLPPGTPPVCTPRPPVTVAAVPTDGGRLRVTLTTGTNPGAANLLQAVQFTRLANATVAAGGQESVTGRLALSPPAATLTFTVSRATPGQTSTVEFDVTDGCGTWPSFVGGGPGAF